MKLRCGNNSRSQKREELRRSRDRWKARVEDEECYQKIKEEAWRLFERQPGFKRKTREEFEEEFGRKVRNVMGNSRGEQEKALQKWSSEMQRTIQPEERRREARERQSMGAGGFQLPKMSSVGEDMGSASPRRFAVSCSWKMSRDVRLDVELTALVSSVETT